MGVSANLTISKKPTQFRRDSTNLNTSENSISGKTVPGTNSNSIPEYNMVSSFDKEERERYFQ